MITLSIILWSLLIITYTVEKYFIYKENKARKNIMTNKIERKFTPEECIENGGHFWKYWGANDSIDPKTFNLSNIRYDVYYPNGEPRYRGCPLCGTVEQEVHGWVNINKKEK